MTLKLTIAVIATSIGASCATAPRTTAATPVVPMGDLIFVADPGIRAESATLPVVRATDDGWEMVYVDPSLGRPVAAESQDGLAFSPAARVPPREVTEAPSTVALADGSMRLFVSLAEGIISFRSTDAGRTFTPERGTRLTPDDFDSPVVHAMVSPTPIRLADGRFRLYVAAISSRGPVVLSATTPVAAPEPVILAAPVR